MRMMIIGNWGEPFPVDGRWFCDKGNARVDNGNDNVLELHDEGGKRCVIRRGFQGSYYQATFKFKWDTSTGPGWVVRWRDPGNWLAIALIPPSGMGGPQPALCRRKDDGTVCWSRCAVQGPLFQQVEVLSR